MADVKITSFNLNCPVPRVADDRIVLAHGGGGRLTHQLIEKIFLPSFANDALEQRHDGAVVAINGSRLAFTTDSFVVRPLIFPGGNIGDLAVNGTVNDLAMCGARPFISVQDSYWKKACRYRRCARSSHRCRRLRPARM